MPKKTYPKKSMEINYDLGEAILYAFPEIRVDVHHPDVLLHVEVREEIYIYSEIIPGPGGMPIGTNGTAMLLLIRWNRQSGCRLYDLQTWRRTGGNLFPCTAVHQRAGQTEGSGSCKAGFQDIQDRSSCMWSTLPISSFISMKNAHMMN